MPYSPQFAELATRYSKDALHSEMIDMADIVIVMHIPEWLTNNWHKLRHKRVIWRSIGQSINEVEEKLRPLRADGLQVVRYSPKENEIPGFIGSDAMIRFGKDPLEYGGWTGSSGDVINFTQSMRQRADHCGWDTFQKVVEGFPAKLYGVNNEPVPFWAGATTYEEQKRIYREGRVYVYTPTYPASYTLNFIEAWMTGIPIVAVGPNLGNPTAIYNQQTYEVSDLITNGVDGFWSDDISELRQNVETLLHDDELAAGISRNAQNRAQELFGVETIRKQWGEFLN